MRTNLKLRILHAIADLTFRLSERASDALERAYAKYYEAEQDAYEAWCEAEWEREMDKLDALPF